MTRQSKKWFANTAVEIVALVLLFSAVAHAQVSSSGTGTYQYFGQQYVDSGLDSTINQQYGSNGVLSTNVVSPLLNGASMTTMGGQSFNAQMWCPASQSFLSATIVPSGTGDIQAVIIAEDTDFNGSPDYSFSLPAGLRGSGICGNGIISCDAGTWGNCSYWKWIADTSGRVGLQQVTREALGGCFCVNNYCGSSIVLNHLQLVLTSLGGGIVGAVQATNPRYAISNSTITDTTIKYFAQNSGSCSQLTSADPTSYYSNPENMSSDASSAASMDLQDQNSVYYTVMNSQAATENRGQFRTCTVKNTPVVNTQSADPTYTWLPWLHIYDFCWWGRDSVDGCGVAVDVDRNSDGIYDTPQDTYSWGSGWAVYEDINIVGRPLATNVVAQSQQKYSVSATDVLEDMSSEQWWRTDGGGRGMTGDQTFYIVDYKKKSPPICPDGYTYSQVYSLCYQESAAISTSDTCSQFASNAGCRLKDESIDGVVTFRAYQTTGLTPLSSCKTVTGKLQSYSECSQWWEKDRTYLCQGEAFDFSDATARSANIEKTVTNDSLNITYQDLTKDPSGNAVTTNYGFQAPMAAGTTQTCQQACETKKPLMNTTASTTTTKTETLGTSDSSMTLFKKCTDGGTCPVDSSQGEEVIKPCQCMNAFVDMAGIINALADAGKNIVCSDGLTDDTSD